MSKGKKNDVPIDKKTPLISQLETIAPYSVNILLRDQMGLPVNGEAVKTAKFVVSAIRAHKTLEKEQVKLELMNRKFNFNVLDKYGSNEDKQLIKDLFSKSVNQLQFLPKGSDNAKK